MTKARPDVNDTLREGGPDAVRGRHDRAKRYNGKAEGVTLDDFHGAPRQNEGIPESRQNAKQDAPRFDWRKDEINFEELQTMTFSPITFLVPTLIPNEGICLICAKPKVGKSWLVLDVAIAATSDRSTLGAGARCASVSGCTPRNSPHPPPDEQRALEEIR